ncbi:MAG: hypothetical protein ACJAV5_000188 [Vicingaceae bacterium]
MLKLAHLVNPVKVTKSHELYAAQPITFASMLNAKNFTKNIAIEIVLASTQYPEDKEIIPDHIRQLSNLNRSVADCNPKVSGRKLPLLKDILNKSKEIENVDYIIYTNVDIGLMPYFYDAVANYIKKGNDAIIINKRRLTSNFNRVDQLPEIYANLGMSHPGFDCFVFKADLLEKLLLDDICVGVPFSGVSLLHNLVALSENLLILTDSHLTFHIGMNVLGFKKDAYYQHNKAVFFKNIHPNLKSNYDLKKFPYGTESILKRSLKWVLNPSIFATDYLALSGKSSLQKMKLKLDEMRWRILQR